MIALSPLATRLTTPDGTAYVVAPDGWHYLLPDGRPGMVAPADYWQWLDALAAAEQRAALWKRAAKHHRKLHKGYDDAATHFAGEARRMAALATENADRADAAEAALADVQRRAEEARR